MLRWSIIVSLAVVISPYICIGVNGKVDQRLDIVLLVQHQQNPNKLPSQPPPPVEFLEVVRLFPNHFKMSDDAVRFAVIVYHTFAEIMTDFTGEENAIRYMKAPSKKILDPGRAEFNEVSKVLKTEVTDVLKRARKDVPKFVILLTCYFPTLAHHEPGLKEAKEEAEKLRNEYGVTLIVGFIKRRENSDQRTQYGIRDNKELAGDNLFRLFENVADAKRNIDRLVEIFRALVTSTSSTSTSTSAETSTTTTTEPISSTTSTTSTTTTEPTSLTTSTTTTTTTEPSSSTTSTSSTTTTAEPTSSTTTTEPTSSTTSTSSTTTTEPTSSTTSTTKESVSSTEKAVSSNESSTEGASPASSTEESGTSATNQSTVAPAGGAGDNTASGSGGSGSSFPGWAIALIVCVAILLILAVIVALVVTRRKKRKPEAKLSKEKALKDAAAKKKADEEKQAKQRAAMKKMEEKKSAGKKGTDISMIPAGRSIGLINDPGGAEQRMGVSLREDKTQASIAASKKPGPGKKLTGPSSTSMSKGNRSAVSK